MPTKSSPDLYAVQPLLRKCGASLNACSPTSIFRLCTIPISVKLWPSRRPYLGTPRAHADHVQARRPSPLLVKTTSGNQEPIESLGVYNQEHVLGALEHPICNPIFAKRSIELKLTGVSARGYKSSGSKRHLRHLSLHVCLKKGIKKAGAGLRPVGTRVIHHTSLLHLKRE